MRRGTTPTVTLRIGNADGSPCDLTGAEIHVAFQSGTGKNMVQIVKREDEMDISVDGNFSILSVPLTQQDTLRFSAGKPVRVQMRCKKDGLVQASSIMQFEVEEILEEGEI